MQIINGKEIAQKIIERLKGQSASWRTEKILAVIQVGENPASLSFIKQKEKVSKELNVDFRLYKFTEELSQDDLRKEVVKISNLKKVGGIIVQLPLPDNINPARDRSAEGAATTATGRSVSNGVNAQYVLNAIPREKDIDVLGERALGAFYAGRNPVLPPAAATVEELLQVTGYELKVAKVAVVGLGQLVGKPISVWLMKKCKELYLLDQESDLGILKQADLVICGVGKAGIIKPDMLKESASIIDFGYERSSPSVRSNALGSEGQPSFAKASEGQERSGKISGDFDSSQLTNLPTNQLTNFYTPTPGGTGPVLVAKIFENFYTLNNESR